jgi:hypothetical protein
MKKLLVLSGILLFTASLFAQSANTGTSTLSVSVGAESAIVVNTTPAFSSNGIFGDYTAITPLTYYVRTTSGGGGSITVKVTTDFSTGGANGGPSVANPPTAGDALTYTCTAAAPAFGTATACSSAQTASTSTATNVVTFAASTQSAKAGNSASTSWDLTNDPNYKAGSYSAVVTYTISAT